MRTKYQKLTTTLLTEMFKRVGLVYTEECVAQDEWYRTRSWTANEQQAFATWAEKQFKKVFKESTIEWCRKEVGWFLLNYGWTTAGGY